MSPLDAFIYRHESLDALKLQEDYGKFHDAKDPVLLWLGIGDSQGGLNFDCSIGAEGRLEGQVPSNLPR
jgi:hypothetical protein